jgi:hypothetical protein
MPIENQPVLPEEESFSVLELAYIEESPPNLWPENQNSNFGARRKVVCDQMMIAYDDLQTLLNNIFISTADEFLDMWEELYGLPTFPAGKNIAERREIVIARFARGPFTRSMRDHVIDSLLSPGVVGPVVQLIPEGVAIPPTGIPLYNEASGIAPPYFQVIENITNFSYRVEIETGVTYDLTVLTRELTRITPAGISFTIVNVPSVP